MKVLRTFAPMAAIFVGLSSANAQNCAWSYCTPQQQQQQYQQNQLQQLQQLNNTLQQMQQQQLQQQRAPGLGQWSNTPPAPPAPQLLPGGTFTTPSQQNCYRDTFGRVYCQ